MAAAASSSSGAGAGSPGFSLAGMDLSRAAWGPVEADARFADLPYSHFSRREAVRKATKMSDIAQGSRQYMYGRTKANSEMMYKEEHQDGDFVKQDRFRLVKQTVPSWKRGNANNAGQRTDEDPTKITKATKLDKKNANNTSLNKRYNRLRIAKNKSKPRYAGAVVWTAPSVPMQAGWNVIHDIDPATKLDSLSAEVGDAEDLLVAGALRSLTPKLKADVSSTPQPLTRSPGVFQGFQRTIEDDHMKGLVGDGEGTAFATDTAISILMNAKRIQKPWDLVFTVYEGTVMVIDARDSATQMDLESETVHETSKMAPWNDSLPDGAPALAIEATNATRHLREAIVTGDPMAKTPAGKTMEPMEVDEHPMQDDAERAGKTASSVLYRYRRFSLGSEKLVVRTALHGVNATRSEPQLHTVFAVTERWDETTTKSEWKRSVRTSPGRVLLNEVQENTAKFGKWVASSMLAGADFITFGLVTRSSKADSTQHTVLGVEDRSPTSLATVLSMSSKNMWGIVAWAIEMVREQVRELQEARRDAGDLGPDEEDDSDYKFLLMRWPETETGVKASIKLVEIHPEDFADDDDDEDDDEEEEEEEAGAAAAAASSAAVVVG